MKLDSMKTLLISMISPHLLSKLQINNRQLLDLTCKVANALKAQGIRKGNRVILYLPMIPLAVAVILACARIGAIHRFIQSLRVYILYCIIVLYLQVLVQKLSKVE